MAAASVPADQQVFSPGLLLTHDWRQIHTPRGLLDTTIKEVDSPASSSYQTVTFPITNALQFETFVNGLGRCDVDAKRNCPLQLVPGCDSENAGDCSKRHLSAVVKMTYKVTHTVSETTENSSLSECVIKELQEIENQAVGCEVPKDRIVQFLQRFGSHFPKGGQRLGKCFSWMVVVDEQCNMDLLHEIAEEIFVICDKYEAYIPGSHEGLWYSLHNAMNCASWSDAKKRLLQSARLRVAHHGNNRNVMCFTQWKQNDFIQQPVKLNSMSDNIVAVWHLIEQSQMKFKVHKKLASLVKEEWTRLAEESRHAASGPVNMNHINTPKACWGNLMDDLEMRDYFPAKITLQKVRSLHIQKEGPTLKTDLPWKVLNQVILLNSMCREEDVSTFSKETRGMTKSIKDRIKHGKSMMTPDKSEGIPHPMDLTLLIFMCSDFMLRQVLAKKLFMCCLAIPFIVPTPDDTVDILLWPLRSIVMEWRNKQEAKEEALVTCKLNMVAFMRFGHTKFSKSKLMNTILSGSSHDAFCHKDTPCGNGKRQISNGTVEMSHFLPSASKSDQFSEPALFFNLRGDACDYPVQHSLLVELATVLVILIDLQELHTKQVQELLCDTVKAKRRVVVILTDSKGHTEEEFDKLLRDFGEQLGDSLKDIEVVCTFEDGQERNGSEVNHDVTANITEMMVEDPPHSLEDFAALTNQCLCDETRHKHCKAGKRVAEKIMMEMHMISINERKRRLLPQQGQCLHETGKLLKKLHRSSGRETSLHEKDEIKKRLRDIKKSQEFASKGNGFMKKVIFMFHEQAETKEFAMRWIQMELDAISRTVLPNLHSEKNQKWNEMMKAQDDKKDSVATLEQVIRALDKQIDAATFGMEHIMREMAQLYDVAADLKHVHTDSEYDLSSLPDIVGCLLLEGQPVELMDGDHGFIPLAWVKAVFRSLAKLVGEKKIFVLSVMGIQSSGKSTLLNTLFGLEFAVSAGRCTRGIYAQLLPVANGSHLPFDYMLVLDSEGLRAQELGQHNYEHDNELATLVIGLSDLALINMKGENVMEISDILQIVVLAFLRMKLADSTHRHKCMFVHQNVSAVNAEEKLAVDRQKFQEQLNIMTKQASESQGLHQTITSFNHVISFDGEHDVVYFSDLWQGDPPMAPVNRGYSTRAAETQQHILTEVSQKCQSFLTISDFVVRIEDMWNGVLADDFIFNFRNSLAAKAYLDLERVFARLTMEMEEDLLQWVNTTCNVQMHKCQTESGLDSKCTELNGSLHEHINKQHTEKQTNLDKFFEHHPAKDVVMQWKTEKKMSLQIFVETLTRRMHTKLNNMKIRRQLDVQHQQMSHDKEQAIMSKAIALAEQLRGKCPKEALEKKFDEIWKPWAEESIAASFQQPVDVTQILHAVLWEILSGEGNQSFLCTELGRTCAAPGTFSQDIKSQDITKDHISTKGIRETFKAMLTEGTYIDNVAVQANAMLADVLERVDYVSQQDIQFDPHHGRYIIDFALNVVTQYNDQSHIPFSFTPQFRAMFAHRVVHYAAPRFENMNQDFEEKHGIRTKLNHYRQRVFKQFQNAVQDASTEVTISNDFCETIKGPLIDYVRLQIGQQVVKELHQAIGITKYDLITKMLDYIVNRRNFLDMYAYVHTPVTYARDWVQALGVRLMFEERNGQSRYKQLVHTFVEGTIAKIKSSTQAATSSVVGMKSAQYGQWIRRFYEEMEETISLDTKRLVVTGTAIKDFKHFQKYLEENLKNLAGVLKQNLCEATARSVMWGNEGNPFWRVYERLWGCHEMCPLCKEPCQYSDPHHTTSHSCIQHRPSGLGGTKNINTRLLSIDICNTEVASEKTFNCAAWSFKCRKTLHCSVTEDIFHPAREYKKFLPDWDIAPDPSGEAAKFWKWAMCTFQVELVETYKSIYNVAGVEIPESWKEITEQDARDSLRAFFK